MITDAILASQVHYLFSYRGLCLSSIRCEFGSECSSTGGCCRGVFQWRPCASGVLAPVMCRWCSWASISSKAFFPLQGCWEALPMMFAAFVLLLDQQSMSNLSDFTCSFVHLFNVSS